MQIQAAKKVSMAFVIFIAALFVRALHLFAIRNTFFFDHLIGDALYFDELAWKIASGVMRNERLQITLSPVYVAFLTFFYSLFGHHLLIVRTAQIVMGSLSCVLMYGLGKMIWDKKVGAVAGAISVLYGIYVFYDAEIQKTSLVNFMVLLSLYLMVRVVIKPNILLWALAGMALSTAVILRMHLAVVMPLLVIWSLAQISAKNLKRALLYFSVICLASLITFAAWKEWHRRSIPHQDVLFTENGFNFYIGNNPLANGTYVKIPNVRATKQGHHLDAKKIAETEMKRPLGLAEFNSYWLKRGLDYVIGDPAGWFYLEMKKIYLIFNAYEIPSDENYYYTRKESWLLSFPLLSFALISPLGLLGLLISRPAKNRLAFLLFLYLIAYSAALAVFFIVAEWRLPLQIPLILFAAFALCKIYDCVELKQIRELKLILMLFILLYGVTNYETYLNRCGFDNFIKARIYSAKVRLGLVNIDKVQSFDQNRTE